MTKTNPKKKKCKKAELSEEVLQIAEKRREVKSKGEKERYTHLNAKFQRIARKDKKAFLSEQCRKVEENNSMGKIRDLFKKIRDTKETFHAKMASIKDRNDKDLTEAEDTKKRWQEYTEGRDKKDLLDSICQQIWKTQQWPQDWKRAVFIPIPKKAMPKNAQTTAQLHSSHTLVK